MSKQSKTLNELIGNIITIYSMFVYDKKMKLCDALEKMEQEIINAIEKRKEGLVAESVKMWEAINNRFNSIISANKRIGFTELDLQALRNQVLGDYASLLKSLGAKEQKKEIEP